MIKRHHRKTANVVYIALLSLVILCLIASVLKTNAYNAKQHTVVFSGTGLFSGEENEAEVSVKASARNSTWTKIFDLDSQGVTEPNYQAFTYDFTVINNTGDQVADFAFMLTFSRDVYLASAWNGSLEIHQTTASGEELVEIVPDLREFDPSQFHLETFTVDGESFIHMKAGEYLVYLPSSTMNAMEMPIEPHEGTTPGLILYAAIGENIEDSSLELRYQFHRPLTNEPLFWVSVVGMGLWLIAFVIYEITSAQIRKYQERHERDNKIINESIETFIGFIDAKDPYTNGHSRRVAIYTRQIAKEMGYTGEELDRIYYVALLHDCGKIGVPDSILGKPGRLTPEEFEVIKSHTVRGGEILRSFKSLKNVDEGARYHHERYDGKGYPEGKAGEDIPLIARMICVADSFDAMNTDRVYRKKLTTKQIQEELERNKGLQFDPKIADIMLGLLRDQKLPTER